jgi:hypothetical protein
LEHFGSDGDTQNVEFPTMEKLNNRLAVRDARKRSTTKESGGLLSARGGKRNGDKDSGGDRKSSLKNADSKAINNDDGNDNDNGSINESSPSRRSSGAANRKVTVNDTLQQANE